MSFTWPTRYGARQYPFHEDYVGTVRHYYGASGIYPVGFRGNPDSARSTINSCVEEQTRAKITNLLPPGSLNEYTRLGIDERSFYLNASRTVTTPLMQMMAQLAYAENDRLQAIWLPFRQAAGAGTGGMVMIVILPREVEGIGEVERALVEGDLDALTGARSNRLVRVFLPKFKMTTGFQLRTPLSSMGMPHAFDASRADFGGISPLAVEEG